MKLPTATQHRIGRPRAFDRANAVDVALKLFWERGFEGVEVRELTRAMGIHAPSFYSAFGDKSSLFLEVADRYEALYMTRVATALARARTARGAANALFDLSVEIFTREVGPRGCFLTVSAVNCSAANEEIAMELAKRRAAGLALIRSRMAQGVKDGDLPSETDLDGLAAYVAIVASGLSMQARDGLSAARLRQASQRAALAIPEQQ